jgi:hypothetical protein
VSADGDTTTTNVVRGNRSKIRRHYADGGFEHPRRGGGDNVPLDVLAKNVDEYIRTIKA